MCLRAQWLQAWTTQTRKITVHLPEMHEGDPYWPPPWKSRGLHHPKQTASVAGNGTWAVCGTQWQVSHFGVINRIAKNRVVALVV